MNFREYLLLKVSEECDEIGQRISKALTFGLDESQEGQPLTNRERLSYELDDLTAVLDLLREEGIFDYQPSASNIAAKKVKVRKFFEYARDVCGTVTNE